MLVTAALLSARGLVRAEPAPATSSGAATAPSPAAWPLYAMDTGLRGPDVPTIDAKVALLKRLGYSGIDYTLNHEELPHMLDALDQAQLKLECLYLSPAIEDKPDARLAESVKRIGGRTTRLELALRSATLKPSDSAGDVTAMELLRAVSDLCADTGPVVSVYPHTGLWSERVEDGVRLADKLNRKNVGANFNLVHWKWVKQSRPLEVALRETLPRLFAVSINGFDANKIVSLPEGDYDLAAFVQLLSHVGYRGPIGVQGYGIPGASEAHLARSMDRWKRIVRTLTPN